MCRPVPERVENQNPISSSLFNWIKSLQRKYKKVFSQTNEDGVIEEIFNYVGTTNKVYVEFGAADCKECNTRYLRCRIFLMNLFFVLTM